MEVRNLPFGESGIREIAVVFDTRDRVRGEGPNMTNPPSWARAAFVVFEVRSDRCRLGLSPSTWWR